MIKAQDRARVAGAFPFLADPNSEIARDIFDGSMLARFPDKRDMMAEGDRVAAIPLIVSGSVRVYRPSPNGREITLYRFGRGECCVLSADSILGRKAFPARARVEESCEACLVPETRFDEWLARSAGFRAFIFEVMSRRLVSALNTLEDVAFRRLDARLADLLIARTAAAGTATLSLTHQQLADELGSSREVVSRVLEQLEERGWVRLSRGAVEVVEPGSLAKTAEG